MSVEDKAAKLLESTNESSQWQVIKTKIILLAAGAIWFLQGSVGAAGVLKTQTVQGQLIVASVMPTPGPGRNPWRLLLILHEETI